MNKEIILILILIISSLLFYVWNYLKEYSIDINYYTNIEVNEMSNSPWWEVIRSEESLLGYNKYLNIDLEKLKDVDFDKNAIILSNGRRIKKIVYRSFLPIIIDNYSGIAYLQDEFKENTIFVYLIDANKKLFVDRHFNEDAQYILE